MNKEDLRGYYQKTLGGEAVCTVTEDEYVAEAIKFSEQGYNVILRPFKDMPTSLRSERISLIVDAQNVGQTTFETALTAKS